MKKNIRSLLFTLLCCILLTLIVSLILSFLYFLNLFVSSLAIISKIFGFLVLIICGFLLGRNIREKTFFFAYSALCEINTTLLKQVFRISIKIYTKVIYDTLATKRDFLPPRSPNNMDLKIRIALLYNMRETLFKRMYFFLPCSI